jgi:hypothetical protein
MAARITKVEFIESPYEVTVYDIRVRMDDSFISNGIVLHNSEVCRSRAGVVVPKDQIGTIGGLPPWHGRCRTTIGAVMSRLSRFQDLVNDPDRNPANRTLAPLPTGWRTTTPASPTPPPTPTIPPAALDTRAKPKVKLPKDVERENWSGTHYYEFDAPNGNRVSLRYEKNGKYRDVEFLVDESYDRVEMSPRDGTNIALKLSRCHKYEISKAKDGRIYRTEPYSADGAGEGRSAWYQRLGFSPPGGDPILNQRGEVVALGTQYGVVKNGRLIPSDMDGNPLNLLK